MGLILEQERHLSVLSGDKFIYMIKVAFTNIQTKNKINFLLTDSFTFMLAVRQGCLVSMLLCIIVAEVFPIFIDKA